MLYYVMVVQGDALDRDRLLVFAYVRLGLDIVMAPLAPILAAALYERLRASNEGPAETQLERVFD